MCACVRARVPHLCRAHRRQLGHVDIEDVELQSAGRCAVALQELRRQQLQEPGDETETETPNNVKPGPGDA